MDIRLTLLGSPALQAGIETPFGPERRFQLLAMLGLRSGQWLARDEIAARFWPEQGNTEARRNLRKVIHRTHAVAGAETLEANDHALRWAVACDVQAFETALRHDRLDEALALRRGVLMAGLDDAANDAYTRWLAEERRRFDAAWRQAAERLLQRTAEAAARIAIAERLLEVDAFDEDALAVALQTELAAGRPAQARQRHDAFAGRLMEALGVEPSRALRDLFAAPPAVAQQPAAAAAESRPASAAPHAAPATLVLPAALPAPTGEAFIGRASELAEMRLMLARTDCRLLTLVGAGGSGKSSLARRVAAGRSALWIELQDLPTAAAALERLAQQLGFDLDERRDAVEQLLVHLGAEPPLVVLDNAEHLGGLAAIVGRLLHGHLTLKLLVTSRERLHLPDEWLLPLAGLALPDEDSRDFDAAASFDAVRLFDARARAAQRGFELRRHLPQVLAVLDAVGGLPLAIELAAGWVRLLPPEEIARELRHSIDILARDAANGTPPARPEHHSVRALLERSWGLLAPAQRQALTAVSVFAGGFTAAAARAVAEVALPVLSSLVDKSLLAVDENGRFALHPLVHAFAHERLAAEPERLRGLERRLAEVLAAQLVREAAAGPAAVGRAVRAERANCVAAWQWALENAASDVLAALAPPLSLHFSEAGRPSEGIRCLAGALQLPSLGVRARGRVSAALAWFHFQRGELQRGLELALEGGPLARAAGDDVAQLRSASAAAACSAMSGQLDQALGHCTEALRLAHRIGERRRIADAHSNLGILHTRRGDDAAALGHFEQALAIYRELDQPEGIARILEFIAGLHGHRDEWQLAKRHAEEAVALHRRHGTASASRMHAQMSLGLSHLELGELDAAERELLAALRLARELEQRQNELAIECRLALLATRRGHLAEALERLRALVRTYEHSDFRSDRLNALLYYGDLLRAAGDAAAAARVWRAVAADNSAEAAVPARARRWLRALGSAAEAPQEEAFGVDEACAKVFEPHAFEAKSRGSTHP